jgi:hypothetical protein
MLCYHNDRIDQEIIRDTCNTNVCRPKDKQQTETNVHHRYTDETQKDHVGNEKGATAIVIAHVRKPPHIS